MDHYCPFNRQVDYPKKKKRLKTAVGLSHEKNWRRGGNKGNFLAKKKMIKAHSKEKR